MKRKITFIIVLSLLLVIGCLFCSCKTPTFYTLQYSAGEGGKIVGDAEQTVQQGKDGSAVTADANDGYEFVKWSDGVTTATRQDTAVCEDMSVTAIFKETSKTYFLNYNFGEAIDKPEQITFVKNELQGVTLPVLTREHFTFHGWYCNDVQVTDTNGTLLLGEKVLELDGEEIYAKWTADETFTYKILLVYVTRIEATLPHTDPSKDQVFHVDYTMSEQEREFCHLVTVRTKQRLDEMLDGLVDFQVDEYYATKTFITDDFYIVDSFGSYLEIEDVAEVQDILPQYDSGLILYNAPNETTFHAGAANARYGEIRLDSFFRSMETYHATLEQVIDAMKNNEDIPIMLGHGYLMDDYILDTIRHEIAHTIELRVNLYDYHIVLGAYGNTNGFETSRKYYLHEAVVDGQKVGIPYEFWKGDIAKCTYFVTEDQMGSQGYVSVNRLGTYSVPVGSGNTVCDVIYGEYVTATAIPFPRYKFVRWSDGVTTAERTDLITGDFTVTAIFEKIDEKIV